MIEKEKVINTEDNEKLNNNKDKIYNLLGKDENNIFKFFYKYNHIKLINKLVEDNKLKIPDFLLNYISNEDIKYNDKTWCAIILKMYDFKRYLLPNIGIIQNLLLNLNKNKLQKLLVAIGLILTETPSYCMIKEYRTELLKTLTSDELNSIIGIWPKKKQFNSIIKPNSITKYTKLLAINMFNNLQLYDPIWNYIKLQLEYEDINENKNTNKIPDWWNENWLISIKEIIK